MSEIEIHEQLEKVSSALHRMIQIAIDGKALANRPFLVNLMNGAGMIQTACDVLANAKQQAQQQFALPGQGHRPQ